jgi:L,D-transpeptidase ErfK/SrfK
MRRHFTLALLALAMPALAGTYALPPVGDDLVGELAEVRARHEDTLLDIARRHDIGQEEILLANPGVDRWLPGEGARVRIPSRYILPVAPYRGLVLNLPEMRLYYYPAHSAQAPALVHTFPASIGRMDWATPLGETRIVAKQESPSWRPPASVRKEHAEAGDPLPAVVPPGPDNPLGDYALRLALPGYLIHGTNKSFGVGMRVSHGCIRLLPEDIEQLFGWVKVGTPVRIVNQPVKAGWSGARLYLEVHPPLEENRYDPEALVRSATEAIDAARTGRWVRLDNRAIREAIAAQSGIPVQISIDLQGTW